MRPPQAISLPRQPPAMRTEANAFTDSVGGRRPVVDLRYTSGGSPIRPAGERPAGPAPQIRSIRVYIRGDEWTAQQIDRYGKPHSALLDPGRQGPPTKRAGQRNRPQHCLAGWARASGERRSRRSCCSAIPAPASDDAESDGASGERDPPPAGPDRELQVPPVGLFSPRPAHSLPPEDSIRGPNKEQLAIG